MLRGLFAGFSTGTAAAFVTSRWHDCDSKCVECTLAVGAIWWQLATSIATVQLFDEAPACSSCIVWYCQTPLRLSVTQSTLEDYACLCIMQFTEHWDRLHCRHAMRHCCLLGLFQPLEIL